MYFWSFMATIYFLTYKLPYNIGSNIDSPLKSVLNLESVYIVKHRLFCRPHSQFAFRYLIFIVSFSSNISLQYWRYRFTSFGRGTFLAFSGGLAKKVWWRSIWRPGHLNPSLEIFKSAFGLLACDLYFLYFGYKLSLSGNWRFRHDLLTCLDKSPTTICCIRFHSKFENFCLYFLQILWYGFRGLWQACPTHITISQHVITCAFSGILWLCLNW